jgi:hypothetical protein
LVEAGNEVRSEIALFLELEGLSRLVCSITAKPWLDGVEISGVVNATTTRICGLSLELFEHPIEEQFCVRIVPPGSPNCWEWPGGDDAAIDLDGEDPPETLVGDSVDLGALLVEQLALALPPFPRKPDAVFVTETDESQKSPFAALTAIARRTSEE